MTLEEAKSNLKERIDCANIALSEWMASHDNVDPAKSFERLADEIYHIYIIKGSVLGCEYCLDLLNKIDSPHKPTDEEKEDLFKEEKK